MNTNMAKYRPPHRYQPKKRAVNKRIVLIVLGVVLVAAGVGGLWYRESRSDNQETRTISQKGEPAGSDQQSGDASSDSANTADDKQNTEVTPNPNAVLQEPSGSFVSNHRPNLSGSPAPNTMQSSCITTP